MTDELLNYDALGLAELVRKGEVTPRELVEVTARRIEALDGTINAMTTLTIERALDKADQIPADSVFAGVPTMLKDFIDCAGVRRTDGSVANLTNVCQSSVAYVQAMEDAGLNLVGMTNLPEFASMVVTDNKAFGPTRNPWDLTRTSGGSSGGSAAAIAAGYTPLVHGTDGGGSNRMPSSWCGILGMKPSRYRMVCGEPEGVGHHFFRTHQTIGRSVRDSAALFAVTEDRSHKAIYPVVGQIKGPSSRRLRIGLTTKNIFGNEPAEDIKAATENVAALCEDLGHTIIPVENPVHGEAYFRAYATLFSIKFKGILKPFETLTGKPAENSGLLTNGTISLVREAENYTDEDRQKAKAYVEELSAKMVEFHTQVDVWLTPVTPEGPSKVGAISPEGSYRDNRKAMETVMSYTPMANMLGAPAMSVPLSWSKTTGLPIGSHFSAKPGDDKTLYELAYELEEARPWFDRWAPFSARYVTY
ncbi:MAG: amidase [Deltaproteobacteria bacterium]|nr:amidase [Deltaproteobacteria bacterium]MBT4263982.1 amidase [Deltaproteobacteria bacterium]MBT4637634.1 amidase [Deltaproteobacteria bacterium]MBT6615952.1 amidase [Deltaproteobacteria bacterium]MBT7152477.1 amidase [Deltaproteobacteria bacterium]